MHIEILVEDNSGAALLELLIPRILGPEGEPHTWRLISYKGIGRIPQGLSAKTDPSKRILLDRLPRLLQGYGKTPGIDVVVVVVDSDKRNCKEFLAELKAVAESCNPEPNALFRLAIEEVEAWYLGDRNALFAAYPKAKQDVLARYQQDSPCDTWELLADAIYPGGLSAIKSVGWPLPGQVKHEWAKTIGPLMDIDQNDSPSFAKLRDGLRRVVA
ncbi:MAG: hypothetical protein Q8O25_09540 [Sulfurisoma sp.]|nr:hypothetical protein [Sulfurisoma sp.]